MTFYGDDCGKKLLDFIPNNSTLIEEGPLDFVSILAN